MEFTSVSRDPSDTRQALTPDEVQRACERAFGSGIVVESAQELGGGEFNSVYLIRMAGRAPVILRAAPPPGRDLPWHERDLMRHEHVIQPYLAPIAHLTPSTLMIDFTRLTLPRDYLFQSVMPGAPWRDPANHLSPQDEERLWRGLARSLADAQRAGVETGDIQRLRDLAEARADLLDEITIPHLLHGDLWPVNILIERGEDGEDGESGAHISAVLDSDRVAWGDPLADWTFYLLPRGTTARIQAIFWDEYGAPETTLGARFRSSIYEGLNISNVLFDLRRRGRMDLEAQSQEQLRAVVAALHAMR